MYMYTYICILYYLMSCVSSIIHLRKKTCRKATSKPLLFRPPPCAAAGLFRREYSSLGWAKGKRVEIDQGERDIAMVVRCS